MVKQKIIVNDANIFIDLLSVGLLEAFFALAYFGYEIWTTSFVCSEVRRGSNKFLLEKFEKKDLLHIARFNPEELHEIVELMQSSTNNTTIGDASVWYYAKRTGGLLLTGDRKLRNISEKDGIQVSGIIYVWEQMLACNIVSAEEAADNLEALMDENQRLPKQICEQKINAWRSTHM